MGSFLGKVCTDKEQDPAESVEAAELVGVELELFSISETLLCSLYCFFMFEKDEKYVIHTARQKFHWLRVYSSLNPRKVPSLIHLEQKLFDWPALFFHTLFDQKDAATQPSSLGISVLDLELCTRWSWIQCIFPQLRVWGGYSCLLCTGRAAKNWQ